MKRKAGILAIALVVLILVTFSAVFAQTVDLTTAGSSGEINNAVFLQGAPPGSAGTGVWDPFLRLGAGSPPIVYGYNSGANFPTTDNPYVDDSKTHTLVLSNVPIVEYNGVLYREFALDINQTPSSCDPPNSGTCLLSLDKLKLFVTNDPLLTGFNGTDFGANATLVYDMDAGDPTNSVTMNYNLAPGSGAGDIFVLVPADLLDGYANCGYGEVGCTTYLTLYSLFGEEHPNNDGFEEWAVRDFPFVNVEKTADATETNTYEWEITKEADGTYNRAPGGTVDHDFTVAVAQTKTTVRAVTGTITISVPADADFNAKDEPAMVESVEDVLSDGSTATVTCPKPFPFEVEPGDSVVCTYEADAPTADADNNIATVTLDSGTFYVAEAPFEYEVINDGFPEVGVNDTNFPNADPWKTAIGSNEWDYTKTFTCPSDAAEYDENGFYTEEFVNTATIVEENLSDTATVTLNCQWPDEELDVTKTATTTFTRTWDWDITKGPNNDYTGVPGSVFPHTYSIAVDGSSTDSDWAVSGTITIENNTPFAANIASVTDTITNIAGPIAVNCGVSFPHTLPAGQDLECTYSTPLPNGAARTNTATVTTSGFVDGNTATAPVTFGDPSNEVNKQVSVTDDYGTPNNDGDDINFGPWGDGGSGGYVKDFVCPQDPTEYVNGVYTETVTNTATIDETNDSDTAVVTLTCNFPPQALDVTKTATTTYTRTWDWDITKGNDADYSGAPGNTFPHTYNIAVDGDYTDSDWAVNGTITIENNSFFPATITGVNDVVTTPAAEIAAPVVCPQSFPYVLEAGKKLVCTYSAGLSNDMDGENMVTVTTSGFVSGDTGTASVIFGDPTNEVNKQVNVTDDNGTPNDTSDDRSFGPWGDGGSGTYSRDFTCPTSPTAYVNGVYTETVTNTAKINQTNDADTATVTLTCNYEPQALTVNKTAVPAFTRTWDWDITKGPDADYVGGPGSSWDHNYLINVTRLAPVDSAWAVSGQITIDNNTAFAATITGVTDAISGFGNVQVTCPVTFPHPLPVGGQLVCTYAQALPDGAARTNTVTVATSGFVGGGTANAPFSFVTPTTKVNEAVAVADDYGTPGNTGDDLNYGFTGTGSTAYAREFTCPTDPALYVNGVYTATVINTARIIETQDSDIATVTVTCNFTPQALTINKTAVPTFTRTWNWDITKGPDADYAGEPGDNWLHYYQINVTKLGFTDSAWAVSGQITIDNNTAFPATISGVSDTITGFGSVEVTCPVPLPHDLAAGGRLICTYAQPLTDGTDRVNTATVTTTGFVGGGSDDAPINFIAPTTKVNESVDMIDDYGTPNIPGDDFGTGFDGSGGTGYERTFECPTDESLYENDLYTATLVNTAKIVQTQQSDIATVTVTCRIPPVVDVCPIDAAVYERTDLIGQGMGSNAKAVGVRKVLIPNSADVLELYGQLAGKDQRSWKYARFIRPNGTYINDKSLESPAYRQWAVFWYGEYLTPSTLPHWRARLIGAPTKAPFVQRAFILYPTYRTTEQYVNVWETFDESAENHVFWEDFNGWIPEQQQVLEIPAPQQTVDLVVKVAVVDNDKDARPFELTISAGGVSQFVSLNGPTNGDLLNIVEVTLQGVPAGTDEVVLDLVSPAEIGDSVAMVGATAHYLCVPSEVPNDN